MFKKNFDEIGDLVAAITYRNKVFFLFNQKCLYNSFVSRCLFFLIIICVIIKYPLFSGIQEMLRLSNTTAFRSVGASLSDPYQEYYPPCNSLPYPSEEYWICRLKHYMNTLFHPTSTCRMGKNNDDTAVVDQQLRCFSVFIPIFKKKMTATRSYFNDNTSV